ncbi:NAD(P)H quinone oxidoreductase, putative [Marinomonas sp. MED121]|nr:NAD(P)H quinone oxidoreductase, putative [Marinomonas sp. MED121]
MKGWVDRAFVSSVIYGAGKRYEKGGLKGKKAMVVTSCGGYESMFKADGLLGDLNVALWHIHNGIFHYTGCEVLPPYVAYSPTYYSQEQCVQYLDYYSDRLKSLESEKPLDFHYTHEFDENFKLKKEIEPRSTGHRRD